MLASYHARKMTTCLVIRNPTSRGNVDAARLARAVDVARAAGWRVDVSVTEREGHATELARKAVADGVQIVAVNGGDGTINEVLQALAYTETALAVLPGGTANVWVKEIHAKHDVVAAMRDIVHGERRKVDLGRAGDRYFLLMAGVGLDALVLPRVGRRLKRWIGAPAYVVAGVLPALRFRSANVSMCIDGEPADTLLYWFVAGNTRSYGGLAEITHRAVADDGLLDAAIMHRGGVRRLILDGARLLLKKHDRSPNVDYLTARTIEINTPGLPVQIDGEAWGETPVRFEIAPLALTAIVPAGLRTPLFGKLA